MSAPDLEPVAWRHRFTVDGVEIWGYSTKKMWGDDLPLYPTPLNTNLPPPLSAALAVPEVAALHLWAKDAQQALLDAMEEIIELRLTLGKSDLEPPWLSDAIDQSRATLRALDAIRAMKGQKP